MILLGSHETFNQHENKIIYYITLRKGPFFGLLLVKSLIEYSTFISIPGFFYEVRRPWNIDGVNK